MKELMLNLLRDEEGQGMVEYAIILTGIALLCVASVKALGGTISGKMGEIGDEINNQVNSGAGGGGAAPAPAEPDPVQ